MKQEINYDAKVLEKIIGRDARTVNYVLGPGGGIFCALRESSETIDEIDPSCGVTAKIHDGLVDAVVLLTVDEAATDMMGVMTAVKARVSDSIRQMTDLTPGSIDVEIVDTATPAEYASRFKKA